MKSRLLRRRHLLLLLVVLMSGTEPVFAQPTPADAEAFQARIEAAAVALGSNPRFKDLSLKYRKALAEFVSGNMLFVVLHEMAHAAISEMGLPVLGREEDAADSFAATRLIRIGSGVSNRVLTEAAKGWFMADRRDQKEGNPLPYYDQHGLNQVRAYQLVCLTVGSNKDEFKDLAKETKLPEDRQDSCTKDYSKAAYSWSLVLKEHLRAPDQPETKIEVVYGEAKGILQVAAQAFRSIQMLETVAHFSSQQLAWPAPFTLEMQTCGFTNARWRPSTRKLTLCYELAHDFAELYRAYGTAWADSRKRKSNTK
jgi:Putative metallopeptidase